MGYLAVLFHNNQTVSSGSTAAHLEYLGFRYLNIGTIPIMIFMIPVTARKAGNLISDKLSSSDNVK